MGIYLLLLCVRFLQVKGEHAAICNGAGDTAQHHDLVVQCNRLDVVHPNRRNGDFLARRGSTPLVQFVRPAGFEKQAIDKIGVAPA